MATKTKNWSTGSGSATIQYGGQGDGEIIITSDPNSVYEARSMQITVETTDGSGIQRIVTINQAAKQRIDLSAAVVTASNQTYSGSAKTPTPTVTLNGSIVPSTGYDVSYSNNTNAGTATITITGKGDYTGTASGTFTINQATGVVTTAPTARNVTYTGSSQYLVTSGSGTGTMYYRYKMSTSSTWSSWSITRPSRTTAGTYNIEYYAAASSDGNYTQSATGSLNATMSKASRTLSFADTYMVINTSSSGTKTATPSAGSGDGAITYSIANTTYATINSSTGAVTSKTSDGSVIVTATIAEGTNYLSASASYTLYVFATTHNYSYSGSAKNVTLPPGTYQFQCWGAQGASCSDGYSGGKGGYSVGQLSIANALAIQVLVGGQNGYNGGGSSSGSSSYNSGDTYGRSSMGNGGGASDIRLSDGALLSRMIVAGGGSGGAYCYKKVKSTRTETVTEQYRTGSWPASNWLGPVDVGEGTYMYFYNPMDWPLEPGHYRVEATGCDVIITLNYLENGNYYGVYTYDYRTSTVVADNEVTSYKSRGYLDIRTTSTNSSGTYTIYRIYERQVEVVTEDYDYQTGYAGGGTTGAGYSSTYKGKQNAAGSGGSFGQGANQTTTYYRFCSGAGGGGWYGGGGGQYSDSSMTYCKYSGGGSGFVNTAASAGNRPSGYTGLELDSGTTYAGNTSFPAPGGGNETGHSGNGYVRITRL